VPESVSSPEIPAQAFWWRALLVCLGVAYIGAPFSELGPLAVRPFIFIAILSFFATFALASRELGVIQGQRQQGYYSRTQRSHRAIAWAVIIVGLTAMLLGIAVVAAVAIGLGHSDVPTG
jgi:hypothetical protein